jgi:hypothetical protein
MLVITTQFNIISFAQSLGRIDVEVTGYDEVTTMKAYLIDPDLNYLENLTINSPSFSFMNVPLGTQYRILIDYQGIDYEEIVDVRNETQTLQIQVYETTSSEVDIVLDFHHISISGSENSIIVTEFLLFRNLGDQVYNGTDLKIQMPEDYTDFESAHSCCVDKTDFGFFFGVPTPILPNETMGIDLRYTIIPDTDSYYLDKRAYYDTAFAVVTVRVDELQTISSENLVGQGIMDLEDESFDAYASTQPVFSGQGFSISVEGYQTPSLNIIWIGTAALAIVVVGAVFFGLRGGSSVSSDKLKAEEDALLGVLKEVETDFKDGKIKEVVRTERLRKWIILSLN